MGFKRRYEGWGGGREGEGEGGRGFKVYGSAQNRTGIISGI